MEKARAKTNVLSFFEEKLVNIYKYTEYFGRIQESMKVVAYWRGHCLGGNRERRETFYILWNLF